MAVLAGGRSVAGEVNLVRAASVESLAEAVDTLAEAASTLAATAKILVVDEGFHVVGGIVAGTVGDIVGGGSPLAMEQMAHKQGFLPAIVAELWQITVP